MINYNPLSILLAILFGFIITILSNSVYYFLISLLERLFFKEETKKKITTPTLILVILGGLSLIITSVISLLFYAISIGTIDIANLIGIFGSTRGEVVANLSTLNSDSISYARFIVILALVFLSSDIMRTKDSNNKLKKLLPIALVSIIIVTIYFTIYEKIVPMINYYLSESGSDAKLIKVSQTLLIINTTIKSVFYIVLALFIIINVKKFNVKKPLFITYFILWIVSYVLLLFAAFIYSGELIVVNNIVLLIPLAIFILIWIIITYIKKDNLITYEDDSYDY